MRFDVVVLGGGSAGEVVAELVRDAGRTVAVIEENLVGGECPYVACMPSKALLRSAGARHDATRLVELGGAPEAVDLGDGADAFIGAARRRDGIAEHGDDTGAMAAMEAEGIRVIRGRGRIVGPGAVDVDGTLVECADLVICTGSSAIRPAVEGLDLVGAWSSDQALTAPARPVSLVVLGGGPVGCELAQAFARFGSRVVLVEASGQLLGREDPRIAGRLTQALVRDGIDVRVGVSATRAVRTDGGLTRVSLDDGRSVEVERVLVAAGRVPSTRGVGLDSLGIDLDEGSAIPIDATCRVSGLAHVWAAGDVTGVAPFTHTANYQGRVVAAGILGQSRAADYRAVPRAVYTDPAVVSVGLSEQEAHERGIDVVATAVELADLPRALADGDGSGLLLVTADAERRVLLGASAIGPHAPDWMGEVVLAIRGQVPLSMVVDVVHAFPTYSEAWDVAYRDLLEACVRRERT